MTHVRTRFAQLAVAAVMIAGAFALVSPAFAQFTPGVPGGALNQAAGETTLVGGDDNQIFVTIGNLVNVILGLLGIIFFGLVLYAGFIWMTAQGDSDKVSKAQSMIMQGVVGIIIILSAFAISNFALTQLLNAASGSAV